MFSAHRHHALVKHLKPSSGPVARSGPFALHWLNPPDEAGPEIAPELLVVHDLLPSEIDNNVGKHVRHSLIPMLADVRRAWGDGVAVWGVWESEPHALFTQLMSNTIFSVHADPDTCSRWFYRNTLTALRSKSGEIDPQDFIQPFGVIYRRVIELRRGGSFLDAGTCHGFLPLLLATAQPAGDRSGPAVVGLDIEDLLLQAAARFAEQEGISGVEFVTADLLGPRTESLPRFDTVTAIHLFEHLDGDAVDHALDVLWQHTGQRLIINVPIEETPDPYFGHHQRFDLRRLADMGARLGGRTTTFADQGAWLVVDR